MARVLALLCAAVLATALSASAAAAVRAAPEPVPSLTPAKTATLWRQLVSKRGRHRFATAACSPARIVFYAPTDWMRLATRLAANPSPCAQYYVGVPPLANDKTVLRAGFASQIRALGPNFHALAEMSVTGWTAWVASTGAGWYAAGVEARRRMAAAGFDVAAGDTWSLNELSTAVRAGTGNARANMRAFLNGLHDGDAGPAARGVVFTAGIAQTTGDLSVYQSRLQEWYEDSAFWTDVARATSDWSQEVYGDVRAYAAPGETRDARRDALNEYLQHPTALAAAAPAAGAAARSLVASTSAPLANAAWRYDAAFGWTDVPLDLMQDYVSAQTYALRTAAAGRFGFAWSPRNLTGATDFEAQTDALLVRLAAAIADSDESPAEACGTSWCTRELAGASLTPAWRSFATWRPPQLAFASPPQQLAPGATSAPVTVELRTSTGTAYTAGLPVAVELAAGSATAELAPAATGPWSRTLTLTIPSGMTAVTAYVRDATPGAFELTASAAGKTAGTQAVTVISSEPAPPAPPAPPPPSGGGGGGGAAPDLVVAAEAAPAAPAIGVPLAYTVQVRNRAGQASRVLLTARLPEQVELVAIETNRGRCSPAGQTVACELDYLAGDLVATVRLHTVVRRAGTLAFGAATIAEPADAEPGNDVAELTTTVAEPPQLVATAPNLAPALRLVRARRVVRLAGVATVRVRFTVSEPAALEARLTPRTSSRPLTLLRATTLAGARTTAARTLVQASAARAGSYEIVARVASAKLVRGRAYALRLAARDAGGKSTTLVVRLVG